MVVVALTGGIASGKSTVAALLQDRGAVYIDADDVARLVVAPGTEGLSDIEATFGSQLVHNGELDRVALGAIVFSDPEARAQLNAIVHPRVRALTKKLIADAIENDPTAIVVYAVPLLVESESTLTFDLVVAVSARPEVRIQRLIDTRGMSLEEARARLASQASEEERLAIADVVIDTNGTMQQTIEQVDSLWRTLRTLRTLRAGRPA